MVTEDYISFETAKLMHDKGFNLAEFHGRWAIDYDNVPNTEEEDPDGKIIVAEWQYPLITLQMAVKWIQETHNIIIIPNYEYECDDTPWCYKIFKLEENGKPERVAVRGVSYDKDNNPTEHIVGYRDYERSYEDYSTKEEAIEEGIKYCLENLI